jgi:hypothetical protein
VGRRDTLVHLARGDLIAREEFSIAVAGLAVASEVEPDLGPLAVTYVFLPSHWTDRGSPRRADGGSTSCGIGGSTT